MTSNINKKKPQAVEVFDERGNFFFGGAAAEVGASPKFNSIFPLKNGGWKTFAFPNWGLFSGANC